MLWGKLFPFYKLVPGTDIASAHNQLLQVATDLGLPVMIVYGSMWFAIFRMLYLLVAKSRLPLFRKFASGIGAGLIGYFTFQIADAVVV